jgi:P27 family predicted phage terminase small subunit
MGRNKIPDEVKKRRGTLQPCRASKSSLPATGDFELKPPAWLTKPEKKAFKVAAGILSAWGILTPADEGILTMYVSALARWQDAEDHLRTEGVIVDVPHVTKSGMVINIKGENIWYKISLDQVAVLAKLQQQLGFSPNARAKILSMISKGEEEKDDFSEFEQ